MFPIEEVARGLIGEKTRVYGVYAALGLGWEPAARLSLQGEIGFAWGTYDSGLFAESSVHHLSVAPRVRTSAGGSGSDLNIAVLAGHSWQSLGSMGIAGGLDVRLQDDVIFGPVVKGRIGYGRITLYAMLGVLLDDESNEVSFGIGLELFRVPRGD